MFHLEFSSRSMFSALSWVARSFFKSLIRLLIFGIWVFVAVIASIFIVVLNSSQSVWGLDVLSPGWRFVILSSMFRPISFICFPSLVSFRRPRGHDHLPFLMKGESAGAYLTVTSLWSVGTWQGSAVHSYRSWVSSAWEYILSSLDIELLALVYVKDRSVRWVMRQVSWMLRACLHSLRAFVAVVRSGRVGALSIGSSVTLKSPSVKWGAGRFSSCHRCSTCFQKAGCSFKLEGAYIFSRCIRLSRCQDMDRKSALPGMSTEIFVDDEGHTGRCRWVYLAAGV